MPCVCEFAVIGKPDSRDYSGEYAKFREVGLLALGFELTDRIAELTRGGDFRHCTTERSGDSIDPCGVTLIPPETLPSVADALDGLTVGDIPDYDSEYDDSPYTIGEQINRLGELIGGAIEKGEWVVCFGA